MNWKFFKENWRDRTHFYKKEIELIFVKQNYFYPRQSQAPACQLIILENWEQFLGLHHKHDIWRNFKCFFIKLNLKKNDFNPIAPTKLSLWFALFAVTQNWMIIMLLWKYKIRYLADIYLGDNVLCSRGGVI